MNRRSVMVMFAVFLFASFTEAADIHERTTGAHPSRTRRRESIHGWRRKGRSGMGSRRVRLHQPGRRSVRQSRRRLCVEGWFVDLHHLRNRGLAGDGFWRCRCCHWPQSVKGQIQGSGFRRDTALYRHVRQARWAVADRRFARNLHSKAVVANDPTRPRFSQLPRRMAHERHTGYQPQ